MGQGASDPKAYPVGTYLVGTCGSPQGPKRTGKEVPSLHTPAAAAETVLSQVTGRQLVVPPWQLGMVQHCHMATSHADSSQGDNTGPVTK